MKLLTFLLLLANLALAGQGGGNGGNALVCFDDPAIPAEILETALVTEEDMNQDGEVIRTRKKEDIDKRRIPNKYLKNITSIEMLDLIEAKNRQYQIGNSAGYDELILPTDNEKPYDYVIRIAKRFEKTLPRLSEYIMRSLKSTNGNIYNWGLNNQSEGIVQVFDFGRKFYNFNTQNCLISTVLVNSIYSGITVINVDERLFHHPQHSNQSRGVGLLHEILYVWLKRNMEHENSSLTSLLLAELISSQTSRMSLIKALNAYNAIPTNNNVYYELSFIEEELIPGIYSQTDELNKQVEKICEPLPKETWIQNTQASYNRYDFCYLDSFNLENFKTNIQKGIQKAESLIKDNQKKLNSYSNKKTALESQIQELQSKKRLNKKNKFKLESLKYELDRFKKSSNDFRYRYDINENKQIIANLGIVLNQVLKTQPQTQPQVVSLISKTQNDINQTIQDWTSKKHFSQEIEELIINYFQTKAVIRKHVGDSQQNDYNRHLKIRTSDFQYNSEWDKFYNQLIELIQNEEQLIDEVNK